MENKKKEEIGQGTAMTKEERLYYRQVGQFQRIHRQSQEQKDIQHFRHCCGCIEE